MRTNSWFCQCDMCRLMRHSLVGIRNSTSGIPPHRGPQDSLYHHTIRKKKNMNTLKYFIASTIACLSLSSAASAAPVMALPGVNLGNTFESTWGYTVPTKAVIDGIANAGFKTLRVPCAWHYHSNAQGTIDPAFMTQVTNAVNWAIADGMYVVINEHNTDGWFTSFRRYDSRLNTKLINLWTQVANNFKNTDSTKLAFACANEPAANDQAQTTVLYKYYQNWINAMRATGGGNATRWLLVQGPHTNIDNTCAWGTAMPADPAHKLMMEVHYYDPYQFTQMTTDASWGAMFYFWGAGYHVANGPTNRNATWGEEAWIQTEFAKMKTNFSDRGYPVLLGEWRAFYQSQWGHSQPDLTGQYITQNYNSSTYWNKTVANQIASYGFDGTAWAIQNDLFDSSTGAVLDQNQVNAVKGISAIAPIPGL
jgi:endoglucanase